MAKLTKAQIKAHQAALDLLKKDTLTHEEKWEVLTNFHPGANHVTSAAGAFFTPPGLASDFAIDAGGGRVIDLCAGIGGLAFASVSRRRFENPACERNMVCVEKNPDYVAIGKKILPEATWICADVFALDLKALGAFDCAIANPPFGSAPRSGKGPRFTGRAFEYHLMDLARDIADHGAFIIPQPSAGFTYSGAQYFRETKSEAYQQFSAQTGIELGAGCGVDCAFYKDEWKDVAPNVEIVCADFQEARERVPAAIAPAIEATPAGPQIVMQGAGRDQAAATRRRAAAPLRPRKDQAACDAGLFSDQAGQLDLVELSRKPKPDPLAELRRIWDGANVPAALQADMLAEIERKASPEYLASFWANPCQG